MKITLNATHKTALTLLPYLSLSLLISGCMMKGVDDKWVMTTPVPSVWDTCFEPWTGIRHADTKDMDARRYKVRKSKLAAHERETERSVRAKEDAREARKHYASRQTETKNKSFANSFIDQWDRNGDSCVDKDEYMRYAFSHGFYENFVAQTRRKMIETQFNEISNSNGYLNASDVIAALESRQFGEKY